MSRDGSHSDFVYGGVESKGYPLRSRVPTEKGLNYSKEIAEKQLTKVVRSWRNEIDNIKSVLSDEMNLSSLSTYQRKREALDTNMNDLNEIFDRLLKLYDNEERNELVSRHKLWTEQFNNCYAALNTKIDELCMIGRKQNPSATELTSRSSRASRSSRSSYMARMVSKHAQLRTELSFLEIEKEKEMELKRIRMTKELAAQRAAIDAMEKFDLEEDRVERGTETDSCKPPEQVQNPLERVQKYVKEQSDSLQPSELFGINSDTSPRISDTNVPAHSSPSSSIPQRFTPLVSQEREPVRQLPRSYSASQPVASLPHHGFCQSNLVYSTPFSRIDPTTSNAIHALRFRRHCLVMMMLTYNVTLA